MAGFEVVVPFPVELEVSERFNRSREEVDYAEPILAEVALGKFAQLPLRKKQVFHLTLGRSSV